MPFSPDQIAELNLLALFDSASSQEGINEKGEKGVRSILN
ncbi:DUF5669 family protein [Marinobacter xestospongiae]|nr:DUF5669 family protein [Marinobacter xestospongiae]MCK7565341.1 DUF5669 family protein [Marinobacter xestospongiae]